jgi:hypothetical protein
LESDLFSVEVPVDGCGVDLPDAMSSDALALRVVTDVSFFSGPVVVGFALGRGTGFTTAVEEALVAGGMDLAALRYKGVSWWSAPYRT